MDADDDDDGASSPAKINRALVEWRQGDFVRGEHWFAYRRTEGQDLVEDQVEGLVLVTQSCDVVRDCEERPYVEVCPLVGVDETRYHAIERGRYPGYAAIPALADTGLVADLDRTMTIEKGVIATWSRERGCATDDEVRAFSAALARKRARFAFPDDFVRMSAKLQKRLTEKHDKVSEEGQALRGMREIRVQATPSWDAPSVSLMFWFIANATDLALAGADWATRLESWLKLVPSTERFVSVDGQVATLADMSAADYVTSHVLDLDHLSTRR